MPNLRFEGRRALAGDSGRRRAVVALYPDKNVGVYTAEKGLQVLSSELESNFPFVSFRRARAFRVSSPPVPLLRAEGDCASAA